MAPVGRTLAKLFGLLAVLVLGALSSQRAWAEPSGIAAPLDPQAPPTPSSLQRSAPVSAPSPNTSPATPSAPRKVALPGPVLRATVDEDVTVYPPSPLPELPSSTPSLSPPPDLSRWLGRTLDEVQVVIDDGRWGSERPPVLASMRAGDRVSTALVRRAMAEAVASGHFADASVDFSEEPSGLRATVHVMPRKIIDALRLDVHGAPLKGEDLTRDAGLAADGEIVASEIPLHRQRIEAILQHRGFPSPRVEITTRDTDDPLRVVVLVDVRVEAPRRIDRRVIYPIGGARRVVQEIEREYVVKTGDRADETALDAADTALATRVRARGYYRAEVSHDVVLHRGLVTLRVRVDFGNQFETRYEGNDSFDKDTLDGALDLENETDRTPNHLAQKVRDFYVKRGFLDVDVTLETRGTEKDRVQYLVFHVVELPRVYVAARAYPCLHESDVKKLSEGGPTSAKAIGSEIDSYLEEELPGGDLFQPPRPGSLDQTIAGRLGERGARPPPIELDPHAAYVPETYERAVQHVQELYRSEGFLGAQVGPVQVMRRRCDPRSPPGQCIPAAVRGEVRDVCTYDASGLPLPVPPLEEDLSCVPDAARQITCESRVWLRIPVKLGPRTQLYDMVFSGVKALSPEALAKAADLKLGGYVSTVKIEEARRRVTDAYREEGYAFADVKYVLEQSPDRTRARVRFVVAEGEQVLVRQIVIRGNEYTKDSIIMRRVALEVGQPYRASDVRKTEERIATLGTFASIGVALENPYVPQRNKVVIITVVERPRQYTEVAPGFSTGEGFRLASEYGHRNLWGDAVGVTMRLQLAYIPTPLIIDPTARSNYRDLNFIARLAVRATASLVVPEIGLGPLFRGGFDAILVHDLQRDFYITKLAAVPNIGYRPVSEVQITLFNSFEFNNSRIFQTGSIDEYITGLARQGINTTDIVRQLLVPDGESYVVAQRVLASWDRRDNAFNASRGTYVVTGVEHVDGFPVQSEARTAATPPRESHFLKLTQTFGGYIPLPKGLRIAALTRLGGNVQLTTNSSTYPDRLFFMGGVDSMRGWNLNSFIPQDDVDRIEADKGKPDFIDDPQNPGTLVPNPTKFTQNTRPIRGGNLMVNERVELRIPISGPIETVIFTDIGNLWIDPLYPFKTGQFPMRVDVGTGIRLQTPVGPLAVDYGFNVTRKSYEDLGAINFAIGLF